MKAAELARLRGICEAATPGPWVRAWYPDGEILPDGSGGQEPDYESNDVIRPQQSEHENDIDVAQLCHSQDANFICTARTALPDALDEIERLRAELAQWREREGACCPEDVGFEEAIKAIRARLKLVEEFYYRYRHNDAYLMVCSGWVVEMWRCIKAACEEGK